MLRRHTIEVELLSKKGGGRRYTYRYNLHFSVPEPGELVVVPFAKWILPAVVLSVDSAESRIIENRESPVETEKPPAPIRTSEYLKRLRPVLGVSRNSNFLRRTAGSAFQLMNFNLRPALQSFSRFTPGAFDNECYVSVKSEPDEKLFEYLGLIENSERIDAGNSALLLRLFTQAAERSKRLGVKETSILMGNADGKDKKHVFERDRLLQAMVNLGFLKFDIEVKHTEFDTWADYDIASEEIEPDLFTHRLLRYVRKREGTASLISPDVAVYVAWTNMDGCINLIGNNGAAIGSRKRRDSIRVVIAPSKHIADFAFSRLKNDRSKTVNAVGCVTPAQLRKLVKDVQKGKIDVVIGTAGLVGILGLLTVPEVCVIDSDSREYDSEPSTPSLFELLAASMHKGSVAVFHHFPSAGARECAIEPDLPELDCGNRWNLVDSQDWSRNDDNEPEIDFVTDLARVGAPILVVHNRLGHGSGFFCADCMSYVSCPECDSSLHATHGVFSCDTCGGSFFSILCRNCGSTNIAKLASGIDHIADMLKSSFGETKVKVVTSTGSGPDESGGDTEPKFEPAIAVVATDTCLYRVLPFSPAAIVVLDIADKFERYVYTGAESTAAYLAEIAGIYSTPQTKLYLLYKNSKNPFISWLNGDDKDYFKRRHILARKHGLPPFAQRYVVRVRLKNHKHLMEASEILKETLGADMVSKPRFVSGASSIRRVYEFDSALSISLSVKYRITDLCRSAGIEAIPYSTFS